MFGQLLLVGEQLLLQGPVLLRGPSPGPGARQGEGVEHPVLQLHQGLRGGPSQLHVLAGEVEQVGGGVDGAQDAVHVQQGPLKPRLQPVGQHHLEDVSLPDIVLGLLHHGAELLPAEQGLHRRGEPGRPPGDRGPVAEELGHPVQLSAGGGVGLIQVGGVRVGNEDKLLTEVVKGNDAAEQHQIHVLEPLLILPCEAEGWLGVLHVVIGEVAHQAAGEGGQAGDLGAFVFGEDLPQGLPRALNAAGGPLPVPELHHPVLGRDLQLGLKPQEGPAAPALLVGGGLQQKAVVVPGPEDAQGLDGGEEVAEQLPGHRNLPVRSGGGQGSGLLQRGIVHGKTSFFPGRNTKTPVPDNFCQGRAYPYARGATLLHGPFTGRALSGVPTYPRQLTYAHTSQNTRPELRPLTAPSAVHLTVRFLPSSQLPGLSVKA